MQRYILYPTKNVSKFWTGNCRGWFYGFVMFNVYYLLSKDQSYLKCLPTVCNHVCGFSVKYNSISKKIISPLIFKNTTKLLHKLEAAFGPVAACSVFFGNVRVQLMCWDYCVSDQFNGKMRNKFLQFWKAFFPQMK